MTHTVFIDGEAGTTGLEIKERLGARADIELIHLPDDRRKDREARRDALNAADVSILCLPEEASREAADLTKGGTARLIDASIAFRTDPDWLFGFPEMDAGRRPAIRGAARVSNPGCYACAAISILRPLTDAGLLPPDYPVTLSAVSGYSGGGKSLIAAFEDEGAPNRTDSHYYLYGLGLEHKHTEEIQIHGGLTRRPVFLPSVGRFYKGMIVSLPLHLDQLFGHANAGTLHQALADHYAGEQFVTVAPMEGSAALAGHLDPEAHNGTNRMSLHVFGNDFRGQAVISAVLDNLGKGASGQAVQNLNIMLGMEEGAGL